MTLSNESRLLAGWRLGAVAAALAYVVLGPFLDSVVFPEGPADDAFYPPAGYTFSSRTEGFRQTILGYDDTFVWSELVLEPHAPGPPEHVHATFPEHFIVSEGTLTLLVNGEKKTLGPGDSLLVPPGVPHKPYNETGEPVVVRGPMEPAFGLPRKFAVFLTQAYAYFDEADSNSRPPAVLLQFSRLAPVYDVWLAQPPLALQRAAFFLIRPMARVLGYRTHYDRYRPRIAA